MKRPLVYPPVVIAHIAQNIGDLIEPKIRGKDSVEIHYSAQMNGHPHLGTMTSLGVAFAAGEYIQKRFNKPAVIKFEVLENAPAVKMDHRGKIYDKMYCDVIENGRPLSEEYLDSFKELLNFFSTKSKVAYELLYYKDFQEVPFVRKTLIKIIQQKKKFLSYIAPTERRLRIRFPCPICKFAEKTAIEVTVKPIKDKKGFIFHSYCNHHGPHSITLLPNNNDFIDFNTSIRNVIKEAKFIEDAKKNNALNLMIDGGDWVGMAFQVGHSLDLLGYQYHDMALRIFTPIIEDWSGAKFSKSIYVQSNTYKSLPAGLVSYTNFKKEYGKTGMEIIWTEVKAWIEEPKKLFRNYSIDYFEEILDSKKVIV